MHIVLQSPKNFSKWRSSPNPSVCDFLPISQKKDTSRTLQKYTMNSLMHVRTQFFNRYTDQFFPMIGKFSKALYAKHLQHMFQGVCRISSDSKLLLRACHTPVLLTYQPNFVSPFLQNDCSEKNDPLKNRILRVL